MRYTLRAPFTVEDDAFIVANVARGPAQIAKALGRDYTSVRDRMRRFGLPLMVRNRIAWTDDLDAQIRALSAEGLSAREIGKRIGASEDGVRERRNTLHIVQAPKPKAARPLSARAQKRRRDEAGDATRAVALPTPAEISRDELFVHRLMRDGGVPRVALVDGRAVWVGPDNRFWIDPDKRRAA